MAGLILPALAEKYDVTIFDPRPPAAPYPHITGSSTDYGAVAAALRGADALLHCAMGPQELIGPAHAPRSFEVNVTSVYVALAAAREAGVRHAVHISSLSVYADLTSRRLDETEPPDAADPYGLSKRLGEEVCRTAVAEYGCSVNVLRLVWPTPDELWPAWGPWDTPRILRTPDGTPIHGTAATDLARAVLAALDYRKGFEIFHISGDDSARLWSTAKAERLLGWRPLHRS